MNAIRLIYNWISFVIDKYFETHTFTTIKLNLSTLCNIIIHPKYVMKRELENSFEYKLE